MPTALAGVPPLRSASMMGTGLAPRLHRSGRGFRARYASMTAMSVQHASDPKSFRESASLLADSSATYQNRAVLRAGPAAESRRLPVARNPSSRRDPPRSREAWTRGPVLR